MTAQELLAYERDHGDPYRPSRRRKDAAGGPAVLACWGSRKKADREAEVEARRRPQCRTEAPDRRTSVQQREARVEQHRQRECVERDGGNPPVPPRLFAPGFFTGGDLLALVYLAAFLIMFFTIALLWQAGLGSVPSNLALSQYHSQSAVSSAPRRTTTTRPVRPHSANRGLGMVALAIAVWQVLAVPPATDYSGWQLLAPLLVGGVDSGLFIAPNTDFIVATVDRSDAGVASGVIGTMQRIGSAIGIAVIGTVLFGSVQID